MSKSFKVSIFAALVLFANARVTYASSSSLNFAPEKINIKEGEQKTTQIQLSIEDVAVIGVDVFLNFDPNDIRIIRIEKTNSFESLTAQIIDNDSGTAKFSVSNPYDEYQNTSTNIARLTIEALSTNPSSVSFDYSPGLTTDTNVVTTGGVDTLAGVEKLEINPNPQTKDKSANEKDNPQVLGENESNSYQQGLESQKPDVSAKDFLTLKNGIIVISAIVLFMTLGLIFTFKRK